MFKFSGILIWCTRCKVYIYSTATKLLQSFSDFVIKIQQQQQVWFFERNNVICICVLVLGPNTETRLWNIESSNFSEITLRVVGVRSSHRFYFPIFWEISWGIGLFQCLSFSNERERTRPFKSRAVHMRSLFDKLVPWQAIWFGAWAHKFA